MISLPAIMQVRPSGPTGARIMIVGECPGEQEVLKGEPFVGASGVELTKMLHEAGIMRSECFITNVARSRPFANDITAWIAQSKKEIAEKSSDPSWSWVGDRFVAAPIAQGVELLRKEINLVQPNVIIAFGNIALWALTGHWGVTDWRGSVLPCGLVEGPKVVPSYHPAAILRQWSWRAACVQDLRRAAKESKSRELVKPEYRFIIRPDYATVIRVLNELLERANQGILKLSCDIETIPAAQIITCIGIAWSKLDALCIPLTCRSRPSGYWSEEEEVQIMYLLMQLLTHPNVWGIGQNFLYDAQYFWRHLRYKPRILMDTMIAQHVCWAGQPKALDYQASLYCEHYAQWKPAKMAWKKDS